MANDEHLARLREGVKAWNAWRRQYEDIAPDLRGADLREARFFNANLSSADLREVDLSHADLGSADLRSARLSGAHLVGADLRRAGLSGADLREVDLSHANLVGADLSGAHLVGAHLRKANLSKASLRSARLSGAHLIGADFSGARLMGADLVGADFSRANLGKADLRNADLRGAHLVGADLSGAHLVRADLSGADLRSAHLVGADLSNTDLVGADLSGAHLNKAELCEADLSGAHLVGAGLHDSHLIGADLSGANLRKADLSEAGLFKADLVGADLNGADLQQAMLIDSCLDGANLTGARLWETQRSGWSIKGVTCQHVFWDRDAKEPTEYGEGDFERIFAEKPRIVLRYPGGLSPVELAMLPLIIERLQAEHPDCVLHIRSVQDDGSGATVTVTVDDLTGRKDDALNRELVRLQAKLEYALEDRDYYRQIFSELFSTIKDGIRLPAQEIHLHRLSGLVTIEGSAMSRDTYNISGQAGSVGPHSQARQMTFQQIQGSLDLPKLAEELGRLRTVMKQESQGAREQDKAVAAVAEAEEAAIRGDGRTALQHLKTAGKWALGIAEKIGVPLAVEALKRMIGPT